MKLGPFMDVVAVLAIHGSHMPLHMGPYSAHNTCTCVNNRLYFTHHHRCCQIFSKTLKTNLCLEFETYTFESSHIVKRILI